MTLIYVGGLVSVVARFVSQVNLLLDLVISNNTPMEKILPLFVDRTKEDELTWAIAIQVLVAVMTALALLSWSTSTIKVIPWKSVD